LVTEAAQAGLIAGTVRRMAPRNFCASRARRLSTPLFAGNDDEIGTVRCDQLAIKVTTRVTSAVSSIAP